MAKETWSELYRKYGIKRESGRKKIVTIALIAIAVFIVAGIFLAQKPNMFPDQMLGENNSEENAAIPVGTQQNNETPAASGNTTSMQTDSFAVSYNYTDSKFVFFVKNIQQKSIETLTINIDGVKTDYNIFSGKLPLQYNETLQLSVSKQLCDKEHIVSMTDGNSEQKLTTYPLVCSMINR